MRGLMIVGLAILLGDKIVCFLIGGTVGGFIWLIAHQSPVPLVCVLGKVGGVVAGVFVTIFLWFGPAWQHWYVHRVEAEEEERRAMR